MTVADLIAHLQQLPQDMPVVLSQEHSGDGSYGAPVDECATSLEGSQLVRLGEPVDWYTAGREYKAIAADAVGWLTKNQPSAGDDLAVLLW